MITRGTGSLRSSARSIPPPARYRPLLQAPSRARVLKFLREIEANVPSDLDIHIVMDNYAILKTSLIRSLIRNSSSSGLAGFSRRQQRPGSTRSNASSPT
ncbi:MAG: hypothetical protein EOR92_29630 [Mesorhizobium sp.]|nr:MAG: hypothetical protein EOR92_29630 [Mesorhizobium sp.]